MTKYVKSTITAD